MFSALGGSGSLGGSGRLQPVMMPIYKSQVKATKVEERNVSLKYIYKKRDREQPNGPKRKYICISRFEIMFCWPREGINLIHFLPCAQKGFGQLALCLDFYPELCLNFLPDIMSGFCTWQYVWCSKGEIFLIATLSFLQHDTSC